MTNTRFSLKVAAVKGAARKPLSGSGLCLTIMTTLFACANAQAATYVVNQTAGPFATVSAAVAMASSGDTIQITDSATYVEEPNAPSAQRRRWKERN